MQVGDTVKTKHGETLTILDKKQEVAKRNGEIMVNKDGNPTILRKYLAQSGDHKVWFPENYFAVDAEAKESN